MGFFIVVYLCCMTEEKYDDGYNEDDERIEAPFSVTVHHNNIVIDYNTVLNIAIECYTEAVARKPKKSQSIFWFRVESHAYEFTDILKLHSIENIKKKRKKKIKSESPTLDAREDQ